MCQGQEQENQYGFKVVEESKETMDLYVQNLDNIADNANWCHYINESNINDMNFPEDTKWSKELKEKNYVYEKIIEHIIAIKTLLPQTIFGLQSDVPTEEEIKVANRQNFLDAMAYLQGDPENGPNW